MQTLFNLTAMLLADFYLSAPLIVAISIVLFILAITLALLAVKVILNILKNVLTKSTLPNVAIPFTLAITKIFLQLLIAMTVAGFLGVDTTTIIAAFSAVGLAVSLAIKDNLTHVMGGVVLIFTKNFNIGDFVQINDYSGTIQEIGMVHTILTTPDNKRISIPNGEVSNATITNISAMPTRRVALTFTIERDADIATTKQLILKVVQAHNLILKDPECSVRIENHNDLGMELVIKAWVLKEDFWAVTYDLTEDCKIALDNANIKMPVRAFAPTT